MIPIPIWEEFPWLLREKNLDEKKARETSRGLLQDLRGQGRSAERLALLVAW